MRKALSLLLCVVLISAFAFARGNSKRITIVGSTTVLPIAQGCADIFMEENDGYSISIAGGGSGVGIAQIVAGQVDIGDASRKIKDKELVLARTRGINVYPNVVARDGMAIVVHPENTVKADITLKTLANIYLGKIKNWSEIGGPSMPIVVVSRDTSSGTYEVFKKIVLKGKKEAGGAMMSASNKHAAETVKQTKGAIGYIGLAYVSDELKVLAVEGVMPSNDTVNNSTYKIARPLYMYTKGRPKGAVKMFIDFILSAEGQEIVAETGYIPVK